MSPVFVEKRPLRCKEERTWGGAAFHRVAHNHDGVGGTVSDSVETLAVEVP